MKKVFLLLLSLVLTICCVCLLVACDDGETPDGGEHTTHDFTGAWVSDGNNHWHVCKYEGCDVTDTPVAHTEQTVPAVPASCTQTGLTE
ncbi:MAG: hypothetical protein J1F66_03695, partial [Clostridiales bacterium]|nr:hypothetical protein [Clostridiales bacterium]